MTVKDMIKKEVDKLPENVLDEVLDFIRFLELKKEKRDLIIASERISERTLARIWDNDEDAVYDTL
ncbi:MAG: hypothetical protein A2X56_06875 [Nitrospirae bacterium GWC2_57_13]|nr:MAG: hypothetical protein A2072_03725 [Nitrospirae bacterium GWC1_57_7]OGW27705.1 MAG: hypothetical protein A2X56_06875 [Nitrospirae bacterium GWC2_57_13]OGW43911.1 MAG: hypothetical protein A2X57_00315 [Nitrospirae bacterium GWD2_57_8]HAR46757.1 DUF2281 domain-containing protein [Nitrospiraceae bacterium]HAS53020.1 DUF2281 domain-containing protein [Nitrospiraceae bacterium]